MAKSTDLSVLNMMGVIVPVHFEGKSGKHGDQYVDKDEMCPQLPTIAKRIKKCKKLKALCAAVGQIDLVVGPQMAGTVFGTAVALHLGVGLVYAEKDGADNFKLRDIFKRKVQGRNVLLVDDILNMGATSTPIVRMLEDCGAIVVGAYFIVDRGNTTAEEIGVPHAASMFSVKLPMYPKEECLCCQRGEPLSQEYGHAGKKKNG